MTSKDLIFKDTVSAFECAVKYMRRQSLDAAPRLALVESARLNKETRKSVFQLLVEDDKPFPAIAMADEAALELVHQGDLVLARVIHVQKIKLGLLRRSRVVLCLLLAAMEPTYSMSEGGWRVRDRIPAPRGNE